MAEDSGAVGIEKVVNEAYIYTGKAFQFRASDKALDRVREGKVTSDELVAKGLRLQKLEPLPAPRDLGDAFVDDLNAISEAVNRRIGL